KLYPTMGHPGPWDPDRLTMTMDELKAVAETVHERGKKCRGHIVTKKGILAGIEAGLDLIDHGDSMDGECISAITETGTFVCPSGHFIVTLLDEAKRRGESDSPYWRRVQDEFDRFCSILPEANSAGMKLVVGDDYGTAKMPHGMYAKELETYVKTMGIAPVDVIRWATKNGAELMGMADKLGTIEKGKLADLLVIDGDPTMDIKVLQDLNKLKAIMKGGRFVKDTLNA
ncbi:MAG: amidohydrolase family protein, partial [Chloroflexi bacterium]|nr:amidohydrolase family protein [Chloroflexota bacterium]